MEKTQKKNITTILLINIPAVVFYFALYKIPGMRPYGNIIFFLLMLVAGCILSGDFLKRIKQEKLINIKYMFSGITAMLSLYLIMRLSFFVLQNKPELQGFVDLGLWKYFVRPWQEINILVSVLSVGMIVFAVEVFYRLYIQNTLNLYFKDNTAILLASAISGIRAFTLGPMSGLVDFSLACIWGVVYKRSGLWAAFIVHMVWDVLFVYFPAG